MSKKILLIEDDPMLSDIYNTQFKQAGFKVELAFDGEQAISKLKTAKPDLLVTDLVLPKQDGWDVLANIQENKDPDMKVVILSNLGQKEDVQRGKDLGVDLYLIKAHYTPSEVVEEVKKLISNS